MSTEQKPATPAATPPAPKTEPNALAQGLTSTWTKFKQGKLIGYPMMALIIVLVAGVGVGWWILHERRKTEAAKWTELDGTYAAEELKKYIEKHPNTIQAKLANLELARIHLGPEGIDKMGVRESDISSATSLDSFRKAGEIRNNAVKSVEQARDEFTKLVDEFKDDPVIRVECMLACAKAEAVLVGIPKEGQLTERRGDPAKAIEWLDKVAEAAPETDWGKDSKKLADALRNQNTKEQIVTLQASLFVISPELPFDPTKRPKDAIHGFGP